MQSFQYYPLEQTGNPSLGNKGIIYNVTIKVNAAIADEWLSWMLQEHIPAILNTRCFTAFKMVQLIEVDDSEGPTYAVQYDAKNTTDYQKYITEYAADFDRKALQKWGQQFISFGTAMQVIH